MQNCNMRLLPILISLWAVVEVTCLRRREHDGHEQKPERKLLEYTYTHSDVALWNIKAALMNKRLEREFFQTPKTKGCHAVEDKRLTVVDQLHETIFNECGYQDEMNDQALGRVYFIDETARKVLSIFIPDATKKILLGTLNEFVISHSIGTDLVTALYQNVNRLTARDMEYLTYFLYRYKNLFTDGALNVIASLINDRHSVGEILYRRVERFHYYFEKRFDVMQSFVHLSTLELTGSQRPSSKKGVPIRPRITKDQFDCVWAKIKEQFEEMFLETFQFITCTIYGEEITNITPKESAATKKGCGS